MRKRRWERDGQGKEGEGRRLDEEEQGREVGRRGNMIDTYMHTNID